MDKHSKLKSWRHQFFPVKEKVITDEDRPAEILKMAEHGIKLKEKRNASSSRRKSHRR